MSTKNLDNHNRWRNKTVAFRVSPEGGRANRNRCAALWPHQAGLHHPAVLYRDVVVPGNPRVYKALRNELAAVLAELQRIEAGSAVDGELLDTIRLIAAIMYEGG